MLQKGLNIRQKAAEEIMTAGQLKNVIPFLLETTPALISKLKCCLSLKIKMGCYI